MRIQWSWQGLNKNRTLELMYCFASASINFNLTDNVGCFQSQYPWKSIPHFVQWNLIINASLSICDFTGGLFQPLSSGASASVQQRTFSVYCAQSIQFPTARPQVVQISAFSIESINWSQAVQRKYSPSALYVVILCFWIQIVHSLYYAFTALR